VIFICRRLGRLDRDWNTVANAPVADAQAVLVVGCGEPAHVATATVLDQAIERVDHSPTHRGVETPEVAPLAA
jgi:hypothetical protein